MDYVQVRDAHLLIKHT